MDQDEAFRRVWQTFRTFDRVADGRHDTADWRSNTGDYAVCIVRIPPGAIAAELEPVRKVLAVRPFVRIHPDHFLHITLQELGFLCDRPGRADEISPARLDEFVEAAARPVALTRPFEIDLGGINSFQDAAFLDIHDHGHCAKLHARLHELAAVPHMARYGYLPHSTIAHYTADRPIDGLAGALAPWRDTLFATFRVTQVEVVTLHRDETYPSLEPYAVIPLKE
jgi:2'-5' RNA ligase